MSTILTDMRLRLEKAYGVAEAADACARIGQTGRGVEIANDADDLIMDAERLLDEIARLAAEREADGLAGGDQVSASSPKSVAEEGVDAAAAAETIRLLLHQARETLHRAVGVIRAAELRATTSGPSAGMRFALAVEPLLYDVKHFINTASILNRISRQSGRPRS